MADKDDRDTSLSGRSTGGSLSGDGGSRSTSGTGSSRSSTPSGTSRSSSGGSLSGDGGSRSTSGTGSSRSGASTGTSSPGTGSSNTGNNPGNPNAAGYNGGGSRGNSTGTGFGGGSRAAGVAADRQSVAGYAADSKPTGTGLYSSASNTGNNPGNPNAAGYNGGTGSTGLYSSAGATPSFRQSELSSMSAADQYTKTSLAEKGLASERQSTANYNAARGALLDTISGTESPGYNVMYGGTRFTSYEDHPRTPHKITSGPNKGKFSTAAGKYQFTAGTWDRIAAQLGLTDFSPASQDKAALALAEQDYKAVTGRSLDGDLAKGQIGYIGTSLSGTWTSLPGGIEQATTVDRFTRDYNANVAARTNSPQPASQVSNTGSLPNATNAIPSPRPSGTSGLPDTTTSIPSPRPDVPARSFSEKYLRPANPGELGGIRMGNPQFGKLASIGDYWGTPSPARAVQDVRDIAGPKGMGGPGGLYVGPVPGSKPVGQPKQAADPIETEVPPGYATEDVPAAAPTDPATPPKVAEKKKDSIPEIVAGIGFDVLAGLVPGLGIVASIVNTGLALTGRQTTGQRLADAIFEGDNQYQPGSTPSRGTGTDSAAWKRRKASDFASKYLRPEVVDEVKPTDPPSQVQTSGRPTPKQKWIDARDSYAG